MLALAEKTKTVPIAIKTTTTIAMQSATGLSLEAVIIELCCAKRKKRFFPDSSNLACSIVYSAFFGY
jgi:hypothetical protein